MKRNDSKTRVKFHLIRGFEMETPGEKWIGVTIAFLAIGYFFKLVAEAIVMLANAGLFS